MNETRDPAVVKRFTKKVEGNGDEVFRMDNPNELMEWNPRLVIQNTGDEIIDGLRVEVTYITGKAYGIGVKQQIPIPFATNEPSTSEITTFGKLLPKQKASIYLHSLLLDQMLQSLFGVYDDKDHEGTFKVRVYCRLAGSSTYDAIGSREDRYAILHWRPTGFSDRDKCEKIRKMQPLVEVSSK